MGKGHSEWTDVSDTTYTKKLTLIHQIQNWSFFNDPTKIYEKQMF